MLKETGGRAAGRVRMAFSREFLAEALCVDEMQVHFVVCRYEDEEDRIDIPAVKVDGIGNWVFCLDGMFCRGRFLHLSDRHRLISAEVSVEEERILFRADGCETELRARAIPEIFGDRIFNSAMFGASAPEAEPTIRRNRPTGDRQLLTIEFNKRFWSRLIHVAPGGISYGILHTTLRDDCGKLQDESFLPVLRIRGADDVFFHLRAGRFVSTGELYADHADWSTTCEFLAARTVATKQTIKLTTCDSKVKVEFQKIEFYRDYLDKVANDMLC